MMFLAPRHATETVRSAAPHPWLWLAILVAVAVATRAVQYGNPVVHVDDQFYLLVGDRMLHGALPYVDIWDRKPVGLFLLYAAIRALGGEGFVQYQLVATAFAVATAFVLGRIALRIAAPAGALLSGVIYLIYLCAFGGEAGQAPVFYNLFVALAALVTLDAVERIAAGRGGMARGCGAMLLMGIALQIKYSAVFEGAYFGVTLMWATHRATGRWATTLARATVWAGIALAPTVAAWLAYVAIGHGDAFVYANFQSIFERGNAPIADTLGRLAGMVLKVSPLAAVAVLGVRRADRGHDHARGFVAGWAASAVGGILIFGSYFDHYALPMLVPLAVAAAPLLGRREVGLPMIGIGRRRRVMPIAAVLIVFAVALGTVTIAKARRVRGTGAEQRAMAAYIAPRLSGRCLFVYDGETVLYTLTHSCLPTRWPFPDHLNNAREDDAIGIDPLTEVKRIMATRPPLVVSSLTADDKMNWRTWNYMQGELRRAYYPARSWPIGERVRIVYRRRPGM